MKGPTIIIADDHAIIRQGVRSVLESQPGWKVCGEAENGRSAIKLAQKLQPDIAILDITMPDLNGIDTIRILKEKSPRTRVLILTMHESEALAEEVINAGGHGYLLKSDAPEMLPKAIKMVAKNQFFLSTQFSSRTAATGKAAHRDLKLRMRLTPRERQILQLLAEGKSNKGVADALDISNGTVETHRKNILSKLKLHSTADLVRFAIRNNLARP